MNRHIVFGTAGHVDHGKTSFIKHLTGIETDRLAMEKERGITIENGFAHLTVSSDVTVGFIDVPGHEKFIKTMLAGAMGMDAVILVIAADEGIKPQTVEHLNIVKHLNVQRGFVLITKVDLSDELALYELKEAIKDLVKDSIFESAPILPYSVLDLKYKSAVISEIERMTQSNYDLPSHASSRLHVDRVFTRKGHGTVVTGTLIEGNIHVGEILYLYPGDKPCRVKAIQIYGCASSVAHFGQRVALNLSLPLDAINKGDVLSSQNSFNPTMIIDIQMKVDIQITHWQRLKLYHGTREILCRIVLPESKTVEPHMHVNAQLRLESPIYCKNNDKVILRNYSPMQIVGGGNIINAYAKKKKNNEIKYDISMEMNELIEILKEGAVVFQFTQDIFSGTSMRIEKVHTIFNQLMEQELVIKLDEKHMILSQRYSEISEITLYELHHYHQTYPLRFGMPRETLRSKISKRENHRALGTKEFSLILSQLKIDTELIEQDDLIALSTHDYVYSSQEVALKTAIVNLVSLHPQHLVAFTEIDKIAFNKNLIKEMLNHLINYEFLVKINDEYVMDAKLYLSCKEQLIQFLSKHDSIEVASFRDLLGFSRKSTVTLLEHFDKIQLTQRINNKRIINKS